MARGAILALGLIALLGILPGELQADGYHTPFRSVRELKRWWTTQQAEFPGLTTPRPDQANRPPREVRECSPGSVPGEVRKAMDELLQVLRFFHAENVIRTEFPSITGKSIGSVHDEIKRIIGGLGEIGLPYLLQEIQIEIAQKNKPRWTPERAASLAQRTARDYYDAALEKIGRLEEDLTAETDPEKIATLIRKIEHLKVGIDLRSLQGLEARLTVQYQTLRPRKKYLASLLDIVKDMGVTACGCLISTLPAASTNARRILTPLLVGAVRKGVSAKGEPGWRTSHLKRLLPSFLVLLEAESDDLVSASAECLFLLTKRRYGNDVEQWTAYLTGSFAPEIGPAIERRRRPIKRPPDRKTPPRQPSIDRKN